MDIEIIYYISAGAIILLTLAFLIIYSITNNFCKKYSKRYSELLALNEKYKWHEIPKLDNIYEKLTSRASFSKFNPDIAIFGAIIHDKDKWQKAIFGIEQNRKLLDKYNLEFLNIIGSKSEFTRNKPFYILRFFENIILKSARPRPIINTSIKVSWSYTSKAGRNHYQNSIKADFDYLYAVMMKARSGELMKQYAELQRSIITSGVRYRILRRDKFACQACGATQKDGAKLEVDHIKPVSKGGSSSDSNLQTLCDRCNRGKSNRY